VTVKNRTPLVLDDDGTEPWERQRRESGEQFRMFQAYLEMPRRSAPALARQLGKSPAYLTQCMWAGRWRDRAEAYDADRQEKRAAQLARQREEVVDRHLDVAARMLDAAEAALGFMDPEKMKAADVARLVDVAVKIQRTALDMPTNQVEVSGKPGSPAVLSLVPRSEGERVSRMSHLAAELARRSGHDIGPDAFDAFLDPEVV
jgi:hypothetical protein